MSPIAQMCGDVGAQLLVDRHEAAFVDSRRPRVSSAEAGAVGPAADRHEHAVEDLLSPFDSVACSPSSRASTFSTFVPR